MIRPDNRLGEMPTDRQAYSIFFTLAIPAILELVLTSLVSSIDTIMVGKVGTEAISAVGLTTQPNLIFMSLFFALNAGTTAFVARRKGEGNREEANAGLRQVLVVGAIIGILFTGVSVSLAQEIVKFAGAIEGETLTPATEYFSIIQSVFVFKALTLTINAALRGVGQTKTTLITNMTTNIVNIIFNYLLIGGNFGFPQLGVAGAAIATSIGIFVGFVIALITILRGNSYLKISFKDSFKPRFDILKTIGSISSNAVIEQLFIRAGFFTVARLIASLGTVNFAAHQICQQVLSITFNVGDGLAVAATTLVGQNLGKNRQDISTLYGKLASKVAISVSLVLGALMIAGRYIIPSLFDDNPLVINSVARIMFIVALAQCAQTSQVIFAGALRGAGDTRSVAISSFMAIFLCRPILTFIAIRFLKLGLMGAWLVIPVDQFLRLVFLYTRFASGKWTKIHV